MKSQEEINARISALYLTKQTGFVHIALRENGKITIKNTNKRAK